ncbi:MAG: sigma-70 family RNA polymerase sigma factor [Myxococcales bacterium]
MHYPGVAASLTNSSCAQVDSQPSALERARLERSVTEDYRFIWRLLRRLGCAPASADDATQQVFLIVAERLSDITPGRERSFAYGTALRVAQAMRRSLGREADGVDADARPSLTPAPDELLEQRRARERLDGILAQLPFELRTVFVLYELEGLTAPEIADMAGLALGTVASRLRRARERFRELVAHEGGPTTERSGT